MGNIDEVKKTVDAKMYELLNLARSVNTSARSIRDRVSGSVPETESNKSVDRETLHGNIDLISDILRDADYTLGQLAADFASQAKAQKAATGASIRG